MLKVRNSHFLKQFYTFKSYTSISPGAIVKNQAPHVNFCYSVVLRSYWCRVSEKSGWHFFQTMFKVIWRSLKVMNLGI